jgi:asparagine synthase (glutamine-hydrolysing)
LTGLFSDVLDAPRTRQRGYFEPAFVGRLLREHLAGRRDHSLRLWQLLVFELWHRQYLDAPVSARAAHAG